jgi:hypothetical protein
VKILKAILKFILDLILGKEYKRTVLPMKEVKLCRILDNEYGTFGVLIYENNPICLTLEDKWVDNETNISCIPQDEYVCKIVDSPHFGHVYEVKDVPDRTHILIHKGNTHEDTRGCILPGSKFGELNGVLGVLDSTAAFNKFMDLMDDEDFRLDIYWS